MESPHFAGLVRRHTGENQVERRWLRTAVEQAFATEPTRLVLVTGGPGAGKTGLLAGLADAQPGWLRYFVGEIDQEHHAAGDIHSFLLSIGRQLARQRPELFDVEGLSVVVEQRFGEVRPGAKATGVQIDELTVSPFRRAPTLVVRQSADRLDGSAVAVDINRAHLEPRLLAPDNLAELALVGPARALLGRDPEARIVILLDALDEAAAPGETGSLLDWLATGTALPPNINIVMSSRQHSDLGLLRKKRGSHLKEIDLDPRKREVSDDLLTFARKALGTAEVGAAVQTRGLPLDEFQRRVATRASGNFLYLAYYSRALTDALLHADEPVIGRLLDLDALPTQLVDAYGVFVETARWQIKRLGMIDRDDAPAGREATTTAYAWETVGQPVFGVLTVAQEPLTLTQLMDLSGISVPQRHVRNVIARLRWLLDLRDDRIAFYHSSIGEFLTSDQAREQYEDYWVEETEWHKQIVSHYRGSAVSWSQVDWSGVDRYGLTQLAHHLIESGPELASDAAELPCAGLLSKIRTEFGAERRFLDLVDRLARSFAQRAPLAIGLSALTYLGVVRHQAARPNTALPPPVLGLLARLGRRGQAVERMASIPPSVQQFAAIGEILRYPDPDDEEISTTDLRELLIESALAIPQDGDPLVHVYGAVETAAQLLAPHDLDRALQLWQYGQGLPGQSRPIEPDALYRTAAAAERDTHRAAALIAKIAGERWRDYLDLAERAEPHQAADQLRSAETALEGSEPAARVIGFARLAAQWARHDEAVSRHFLSRTRDQAHEVREEAKAADNLLNAAQVLAGLDQSAARALLAPLDTMVVNGFSISALLGGARLWTDWGEPERAAALIDRYLAESRSRWSRLEARSAVRQLNDVDALVAIEQVLAGISGPLNDPDTHAMAAAERDDELSDVVQRMAEYDLGRAAQIARMIHRTTWKPSWMPRYAIPPHPLDDIYGEDRISVLAALAHAHLDRGETAPAKAVLDELLAAGHAPLVGGSAFSYLWSSSPLQEDPPNENYGNDMLGMMGMDNLRNDWFARVRTRGFFQDPADVVREVELGRHGSLATVVRRFAERLADSDRPRSAALVRSIAVPEERAIGLATLHLAAHGVGITNTQHGPEAEAYSLELDDALADLPHYRWTIDTDADGEALAYLRPDHRVLFEVAVRSRYSCREDLFALADLPFLADAAIGSFLVSVSAGYADDLARLSYCEPSVEAVHLSNLRPSDELRAPDPLTTITQAAAAFHEYRASQAAHGHPPRAAQARIADPLYAPVVDLLITDPGPGSAFVQRVRQLLDQGVAPPALAGLLAFAADARPECQNELLELAGRVVLTADSDTWPGQEALVTLAASPLLGPLVDPVALLCGTKLGTDTMARLFPVLLSTDPAVAMSTYYEVLSHSWHDAMTLLERASDELLELLGASAMAAIGSAVARGLECTSPDVTPPEVVDGVWLARLANG